MQRDAAAEPMNPAVSSPGLPRGLKLAFPACGPEIKGAQRPEPATVLGALRPPVPRRRSALRPAMLPSRSVPVPGPSGPLGALLALLLLTPPGLLVQAGPVAAGQRELRCVCLTTTPGVHPRMITNLQVIAAGPQCATVQAVASLRNGKEVCLDPKAPLIKRVIQKMLERYLSPRSRFMGS
ncbi:C-X-C motif chemokine 6-like [Ctenodactylus gundi]